MKRLILTTFSVLLLSGTLSLAGCTGSADNSVSAPPEKIPTTEELEAENKARKLEYAAEQKKMQQRDRQR